MRTVLFVLAAAVLAGLISGQGCGGVVPEPQETAEERAYRLCGPSVFSAEQVTKGMDILEGDLNAGTYVDKDSAMGPVTSGCPAICASESVNPDDDITNCVSTCNTCGQAMVDAVFDRWEGGNSNPTAREIDDEVDFEDFWANPTAYDSVP